MRRAALVTPLLVCCACAGGPPAPGLMGEPEPAPSVAPSTASAAPPVTNGAKDERSKIQALISLIRGSGMVFIRNGSEHPAAEAADHLASKLDTAGPRVATARDFIQQLASFSSQSGEPYMVRLPDGKTLPSREWLLARLAEIEGAP